MNNQEQSTCYIDASEKSGETSKSPSPLSKNTTYHSFNVSNLFRMPMKTWK